MELPELISVERDPMFGRVYLITLRIPRGTERHYSERITWHMSENFFQDTDTRLRVFWDPRKPDADAKLEQMGITRHDVVVALLKAGTKPGTPS